MSLVHPLSPWLVFCLSTPTPRLFHGCSPKARTGALEPSELETFKKQAECLKFPPQYHFGGTGQTVSWSRPSPT